MSRKEDIRLLMGLNSKVELTVDGIYNKAIYADRRGDWRKAANQGYEPAKKIP